MEEFIPIVRIQGYGQGSKQKSCNMCEAEFKGTIKRI